MKVIRYILLICLFLLVASACSCNSHPATIDLGSVEKVKAQATTVLQIPWGYYDEHTIKLRSGPIGFCIDSEGSIYLDDYTSYSILKYRSDGSFITSVPISRFTDKRDESKPLQIACLANELILYEYGGSVIQKYNLENDELSILDLKGEKERDNPYIVNVLVDENGMVYAFSHNQDSAATQTSLYRTDASLSMVLEKRKLPNQVNEIKAVDNFGNLYFGQTGSDNGVYQVQQVNHKNKIKEVLSIKKSDVNENLELLQVTDDDGFILEMMNSGKIGILSIGSSTSMISELPQLTLHLDPHGDGRIYFDESFYLSGVLDKLPPYCIYMLNTTE